MMTLKEAMASGKKVKRKDLNTDYGSLKQNKDGTIDFITAEYKAQLTLADINTADWVAEIGIRTYYVGSYVFVNHASGKETKMLQAIESETEPSFPTRDGTPWIKVKELRE